MSVIQFFRILWARRLIILIAVLACFCTAVAIGNLVPARYTAKSRVMMDVVKPDPVTGEMIGSAFARAYVKTQIELIRDYRIAGRVADMLNWTASAELAEQYRQRPEGDTRDFRRWLAQRIIDNTDAQLIEASNILEISYTSPNPDVAAKIADTIRQAYVEQMLAFKRDDASTNAAWFRQQAARVKADLTAAETRKTNFERANGIVLGDDNVDQESRKLAALAGTSAVPAAGGTVITGGDPAAGPLAQIDASIALAEKTLGPNHPNIVAMRAQRAAVIAAASARPKVSVATGPSIGALYGAQQAKVLAQRGKVDEARQLAADVAVLRDQYLKTAARAADLQQQGEASASGLTLLGNATAPQQPVFPNWTLLILGSIGLGAALGILASLMVELLGRRVRGVEDLRYEKVPILGVMSVTAAPPRTRRRWLDVLLRRAQPEPEAA